MARVETGAAMAAGAWRAARAVVTVAGAWRAEWAAMKEVQDQVGEQCSPQTQTTVWQWTTPCKARSGRGRLLCTHHYYLGSRRARCGRSTRSRWSPRRPARTLELCRCHWRPSSSPHPEPQTARYHREEVIRPRQVSAAAPPRDQQIVIPRSLRRSRHCSAAAARARAAARAARAARALRNTASTSLGK